MEGHLFIFVFVLLITISYGGCKQNGKATNVEDVADLKEFKKILRTKNNVLACFISSQRQTSNVLKVFSETAEVIRGQGSMLIVDCSGDAKKMCKKLKVVPDPFVLRHYKDGEFHKVYDRKMTTASMVSFMRDPTGDIPWEEDETSTDIVHLPDYNSLTRLLRKETKPIMVMFYAPWCGFCKQLKPEYAAAATALKDSSVFAAIDVNRPENTVVRTRFNITGFPTMLYFKNGELKHSYEGENKKDKLIAFMENPTAPPPKPKEEDWSLAETEVVHLTTDSFDNFIQSENSTLVMFYAPWCGHCKKMKPEYNKAATLLKSEGVVGSLAAVDATKDSALGKRFGVKGYPTVKYFKNGKFAWDTPALRESGKIVEFMRDPKEPPPPPPPEPEWSEQQSEVVHLNVENFKHFLKKKKHVLVMFYAPWCGHCKMAKPEFTDAAEESKDNSRVAFAALDCTKHSNVCNTVGVTGYPTFKYYHYYNKDTNNIEYTGGRKKEDFLKFMAKVDGSNRPPSTTPPSPSQEATTQPTEQKTVTTQQRPKSDINIWSGIEGSDKILQLTDSNYSEIMSQHQSIMILYYDQDCSTCKTLMMEYGQAALKITPDTGVLAACEGKANLKIATDHRVKKFPVLKYFNKGIFVAKYKGKNLSHEFINFMKFPPPKRIMEEL